MLQDFDPFLKYLTKGDGNIVLVLHSQADPDSVGSAVGLIQLIEAINPNYIVKIYQPNISALSERLIQLLNYKMPITTKIKNTDLIIFIDNSNIEDIDLYPENKIIIMDHHVKQHLSVNLLFDFRFETLSSTAEIVANLYKQSNIPLEKLSAQSITAGIIFDTRRFLFSNIDLFKTLIHLLQNFPEVYDEILTLFTTSKSRAERIACIKAAQRMRRIEIEKYQILISHVSSFEAAAARSLILLGGDVAIVVSYHGNRTRISLRSTKEFFKTTNISLGRNLIPMLIEEYGGTGGGHDGAAGYNSDKKIELKKLVTVISNFINENV